MKKKSPSPQPSAAQSAPSQDPLGQSMAEMRSQGYRVLPSALLFDGDSPIPADLQDTMNFAMLSGRNVATAASCGCGDSGHNLGSPATTMVPGGFTSSGVEVPVSDCGTPDLGYIEHGAGNMLPNFVSLANSMLPYTATGMKFNNDTACGIGIEPMYKYYTNAGGTTKEECIPYFAAGSMLRDRIVSLQKQIMALTKDYKTAPPVSSPQSSTEDNTPAVNGFATVPGASAPGPIAPSGLPDSDRPNLDGSDDEDTDTPDITPRHTFSDDGEDFHRIADDTLFDIIQQLTAEINDCKKALGIWQRTKRQVKRFMARTLLNKLDQVLFYDLLTYGICYPELELSQDGNQPKSGLWNPKIVGLNWRNVLSTRKERYADDGYSHHVYLSNFWLNPQDRSYDTTSTDITALPAIDPLHPYDSLVRSLRQWRQQAQRAEDALAEQPNDEQAQLLAKQYVIARRPTRYVVPVAYDTPGRIYYPLPAYWSIYNDIYQYAMTIIKDRAIRKQNENMFGRVLYVHAEYLERLTTQINAQQTNEQRKAIKEEEVKRIKDFLSNRLNNGQTLAAVTFTGADGKDHDAFRIETVPYSTKETAEADKTEIADISSIILFALECHPDLIGSTPGGASSSGGTYQREMLQIKQAKMAPTQQLIIDVYNLVRDYNRWDDHLCWHITQRTLTTLDRSRRGTIDD